MVAAGLVAAHFPRLAGSDVLDGDEAWVSEFLSAPVAISACGGGTVHAAGGELE